MPIYEYDCPSCGRFEYIQKVTDKILKNCPQCEEKGKNSLVEKVVSPAAFHLKGTGWYKTDYVNKAGKSSNGLSSDRVSADSTDSSDKNPPAKDSDSKNSGSKGSGETVGEAKPSGCGKGACGCH